jgi:trk system potassium uptake protein TrkA
MKIIILGASRVGSSVAESLAHEANDITVVDNDPAPLRMLYDRLDIRTILGNASHPSILQRSGAEDADMIVAVTNSDETNMIACQVAYTLFHTPTKIARVRAAEYLEHPRLFSQEALPVDMIISPEQLVTDYITRLIETPGALQVLDFADGRARLAAVKAYYGGPLVGHELRTLREHMPGIETRVAAIFRRGRAIIPEGHTVIEADDEVFFIAATEHIRAVMGELRRLDKPVRHVMLAGGGNIGTRLARGLEGHLHVKTAVFCAVTNDDQINILSAMLAKQMGARKTMALINRSAYVDLVQGGIIDIAISPQQATIGTLLAHVRRGDVVVVHSLRRGAAEAIEAIAHGDRRTSKVVGRLIEQIPLPPGASIVAIVRNNQVIIAHHDTVIKAEDHIILSLIDKRRVRDVERLFQVGVTFL